MIYQFPAIIHHIPCKAICNSYQLLATAQQNKKLIEQSFVTMKIKCGGYSGEAKNGIIGYNCETIGPDLSIGN